MHSLVIRADAVQATYDRFFNKSLIFGKRDCAHLVAFCVQKLGHPNPIVDLRRYTTEKGALFAMRRAGIKSFEERLDSLFERIAPAQTLPGDILTIASDDPHMPALGLRLSGHSILAYAQVADGVRAAVGPFTVAQCAWRVNPRVEDAGAPASA